ncbi:ATP-dependent DNA helicase RecG [Roseimaritima multifibrata]|uniref:Probable DNA 3'-5' helicase RecG n=1 Tax=Roseimaritima multifibrata TaxID=1930274 RepID=A0A517MP06_9BACT|nr:ATP-dependent DNA helicase RecG [Roseimaritima multifibrata]QDS96612.1 ATP-dependent DNA helicase RecG [Roseimaritima multifibrata]
MTDPIPAASAPGTVVHELSDLELGTDLRFVPGVGHDRAVLLAKLGLRAAGEALFFFPRNYEFPSIETKLPDLKEGVPASLVGVVTEVELRSGAAGKSTLGVLVENDEGAFRIVFYNQAFRADQIERGMRVLVSGTPKLVGLRWQFTHPKVTTLGPDEDPPPGKILPLYGLTDGIKQYAMRRMLAGIAPHLASHVREVLPAEIRQSAGERLGCALPDIDVALREIHQPSGEDALRQARTRLVFQELLVMQLALALRRRRLTTDLASPPLTATPEIDLRIQKRFPFALTGDQVRTIAEVGQDMGRQFPMNRLVQGDVGSGKTVIAQYAMLLAVAHGYQAMLMAPTEILARQHYETLTKALAHSRVRIGLLTGSLPAVQRQALVKEAVEGKVDVIVGTQALLYGEWTPAKLGLVVIDEQHKFGVGQRAMLRSGGLDPHYLVLSATPIPRTMAMTMFGDLDVSTLREKPPGRKPVRTYLGRDNWRERWWKFVREHLDEGRQAFVVTPRVADSPRELDDADESAETSTTQGDKELGETPDSLESISSAESVFQELAEGGLKGYRIGLLHGRMSANEKAAVMQRFAQGRLQVLVSTTVIEVGIDIPNATVMTILGAEHFGLAQLHQLRGRVSRGKVAGHVCVFTDSEGSPEENERLQVFADTSDGFELAEADFRLRGPGDLMGTQQSGMPPLRVADLQRDQKILHVARELAQEIVDADSELTAPEFESLKKQVLKRYGKVLDLGDVA